MLMHQTAHLPPAVLLETPGKITFPLKVSKSLRWGLGHFMSNWVYPLKLCRPSALAGMRDLQTGPVSREVTPHLRDSSHSPGSTPCAGDTDAGQVGIHKTPQRVARFGVWEVLPTLISESSPPAVYEFPFFWFF